MELIKRGDINLDDTGNADDAGEDSQDDETCFWCCCNVFETSGFRKYDIKLLTLFFENWRTYPRKIKLRIQLLNKSGIVTVDSSETLHP